VTDIVKKVRLSGLLSLLYFNLISDSIILAPSSPTLISAYATALDQYLSKFLHRIFDPEKGCFKKVSSSKKGRQDWVKLTPLVLF